MFHNVSWIFSIFYVFPSCRWLLVPILALMFHQPTRLMFVQGRLQKMSQSVAFGRTYLSTIILFALLKGQIIQICLDWQKTTLWNISATFPQFRVLKTLWDFGSLRYFWSEAFPLCDVFNIRCFWNEAFPEFDVFNISCWHDAAAPSFLITAPQIVPIQPLLRGVSVKMRISCSQNCQ